MDGRVKPHQRFVLTELRGYAEAVR
jgi:hypothetical protein